MGWAHAPFPDTETAWCHSSSCTCVSENVGGAVGRSWGHFWGSGWGIMPCGIGMRNKLVPGAVPCPKGQAGPGGAAGPPRMVSASLQACSSGPGGSERGCGWAVLGYRPVPMCRWGVPQSRGGGLPVPPAPAGGAMPGAVPSRDLADPQLPVRWWGERIDPGRSPPRMPPHPGPHPSSARRGLAALPALPCLRQCCRVAAEQPSSQRIPSPSAGVGEWEGCWGCCQPQSPPTPPQAPRRGYRPPSPTPLATEPWLMNDAPPSSSSSARLPAPHPRRRAAPCWGGGRRGLRARCWGWQRCHRLSTRVLEWGRQAGSWAAEP